jgi:phage terminase small subunit
MVAKNTPDKKLTRRQEKFVKELVSTDGLQTLRQSAIKAGYPPSSAHTRAWELTHPDKCPHVVAAIQAYRDELDEMYSVGYKKHIRDLQRIRDAALEDKAYSAAVQAEYRRGQAQGNIYISKSEVRHGSIDSMSREEVEKELERIREGFDPIIDITPQAVEAVDIEGESAPKGGGALEIIEGRADDDQEENRDDEA